MSQLSSAFVVSLAVLMTAGPAAAQVTAGPLVRTLATSAGAGGIEIVVTNEGTERVDVTVDVNDWEVDDAGNHRFRPAGTLEGSCGERLTAAVKGLVLEAGAAQPVWIGFRGGAEETCRNIVFFRVATQPDVLDGDRLIISTGVKVYVEPLSRGSGRPDR